MAAGGVFLLTRSGGFRWPAPLAGSFVLVGGFFLAAGGSFLLTRSGGFWLTAPLARSLPFLGGEFCCTVLTSRNGGFALPAPQALDGVIPRRCLRLGYSLLRLPFPGPAAFAAPLLSLAYLVSWADAQIWVVIPFWSCLEDG